MEENRQSLLYTTAHGLNWLVERICALLVGAMVVVIWFGVVERYFLHLGFTWTEEFSRYVMIWKTRRPESENLRPWPRQRMKSATPRPFAKQS